MSYYVWGATVQGNQRNVLLQYLEELLTNQTYSFGTTSMLVLVPHVFRSGVIDDFIDRVSIK